MEDIFGQVEKNIDNLVADHVDWAACASKEQLQAAREGKLKLQFFEREVPKEWLKDIKGKKVPCMGLPRHIWGMEIAILGWLAQMGSKILILSMQGS